jgi:hypothetical protein
MWFNWTVRQNLTLHFRLPSLAWPPGAGHGVVLHGCWKLVQRCASNREYSQVLDFKHSWPSRKGNTHATRGSQDQGVAFRGLAEFSIFHRSLSIPQSAGIMIITPQKVLPRRPGGRPAPPPRVGVSEIQRGSGIKIKSWGI